MDELEELEKDFEEFDRRFDAIENDLKRARAAIGTLILQNAHDKERRAAQEEVDNQQLAMLERHGIEIKTN